jgi:hypothetical protein
VQIPLGRYTEAMAGARGPGTPTLDGTPLTLTQGGQTWEVRVQDVEGLVDLSLAAPDLTQRLRPRQEKDLGRSA